MLIGSTRSAERGEFGSLTHVRPTTRLDPDHCPWGHDLRIGGRTSSYSHFLHTYVDHCDSCRAAGRRGEWTILDPTQQHPAGAAPAVGLALVVIPPPVRAGVGQIQVRLNAQSIGDIDLSLCPVDRRASSNRSALTTTTAAMAWAACSSPLP